MEDAKPWYASLGVWGSLVTIVTGILVTMKLITADQAADIANTVPAYIVSITTTIGGIVALWGRVKATKTIG